jgi:hypothetical protein
LKRPWLKIAAGGEVDEHGDVVLPAVAAGLVGADALDLAEVLLRARPLDMEVEQPPDPGVVLLQESGDGVDRHPFRQHQHEGLEEHREAAARPGPGRLHLEHAIALALDPRQPGVDQRAVLEELKWRQVLASAS